MLINVKTQVTKSLVMTDNQIINQQSNCQCFFVNILLVIWGKGSLSERTQGHLCTDEL